MKIQIILGSTRPGRITERVAKWIVAEATKLENAEIELVDLADYDLPFFDEPISPRYNPNRTTNAQGLAFLAKIGEADGYIVVTPEYNHSVPGVLKNAFDYLGYELAKKPVAIASHGATSGSLAAEHLRAIISISGGVVAPKALALQGASELLDENGKYIGDTSNPYGSDKMVTAVLGELAWWAETLKAGRAELAAV